MKFSRTCDPLANTLRTKEKHKASGFQSKPILLLALLIAYPLSIHGSIINGYTIAALLIFTIIPILLFTNSWSGRLLVGLVSIGSVVFLSSVIDNNGILLLYLMPVLINTGLAIFFGQTLLPGKTPIITKISILFRGKLEPKAAIYTRRVTQAWTMFFILLAVESSLLALFAPIEIWSLFANIINYIFTALFFVGEYYFRIHHLDELEHPSFPRFVRNLTKVNFSELNK